MNYETEHNLNKALVIVDAQRCFMPAEEGIRLGVEGFGELPVPNGEQVVPAANYLTQLFRRHRMRVLATGDGHPEETAHFDVWPKHGREGTPGGMLHPELKAADPTIADFFIKGDVVAKTPEDDNSYSGVFAHREINGKTVYLPEDLKAHGEGKVYVCGLTINEGTEDAALCVDSTAIGLKKLGFNVTVISDAIGALFPEKKDLCMKNLEEIGIRVMTMAEVKVDVVNTPRIVR